VDWPYNEVGFFPRGPSSLGDPKVILHTIMTFFLGQHFFWGPLEKKSHQNYKVIKILKVLKNIPECTKANKIKSKLILFYTVLNKK
jgi:hypothetical protein